MKDFEDFLKEKHAEDYMGTDDNMPEVFEDWLENLSRGELNTYGSMYGLLMEQKGLKRGSDITVECFKGAPKSN